MLKQATKDFIIHHPAKGSTTEIKKGTSPEVTSDKSRTKNNVLSYIRAPIVQAS